MITKTEFLFGKIAVANGFVSAEQIEECIRAQEKLVERKHLGVILLERKYISEEQLAKILEIQRKNLRERTDHTRKKREDVLFGKIALKLDFATEEQINECVRIQAKIEDDLFMRLGEIMVKKGYLSNEQVKKILEFQKKQILLCKNCNQQYNVIMFNPGQVIKCYKCGNKLVIPEKIVTVTAEDFRETDEPQSI